ncbi:MAG: DUF2510 domain-containing protein [Actinomycetota bacterium]|nr:DUF2510 domain-containing protein [Actinomycetota bacterium]
MIDFDFRPVAPVIVERARSIVEDAPPSRLPPRGWYGDPASPEPLRYWTGIAWADGGTDRPPH